MDDLIFTIFIVSFIACGLISARVAEAKGHSMGLWLLAGLFFGVIGLLGAVGMPDRGPRKPPPAPKPPTRAVDLG